MKLNTPELVAYCSSKKGKSDREGVLWLRESEGLILRRDAYHPRWFRLVGNLLFYLTTEDQASSVAGVIILERSIVDSESETGNKYGFSIAFEEGNSPYILYASTAHESEEWIANLRQATYQHLLAMLAELRGRIHQMSGQDPLPSNHPLFALPSQSSIQLPTPSPSNQGEPLLELSLACSSLVCEESGRVPNAFVITSCMTQPQAYWVRYAQTEVIESNCDPRFFTTVIFYTGRISLMSMLKLEVFDIHNRMEQRMMPIGTAKLTVMDLFQAPSNKIRLEIKREGSTRGFMMLRGRKASDSSSPSTIPFSKQLSEGTLSVNSSSSSSLTELSLDQSIGLSIDNLCVKTFQFPIWSKDNYLQVVELMGESYLSFHIPMQLLDIYTSQESSQIQEYCSLLGLNEHWEIIRQEAIETHGTMIAYYRDNKASLQHLYQQGKRFKRSLEKGEKNLEFVPTNLHVQQMKVTDESNKEQLAYEVVTVGCPTAYSLKYRQGGLARWQTTAPYCNANIFSQSHDNRTARARTILGNLQRFHVELHQLCDIVLSAAENKSKEHLRNGIRSMADRLNKLRGHCDIMLINDALKSWNREQQDCIAVTKQDCEVSDICHKVEEHLLCVEMRVDAVLSNIQGTENWHSVMVDPMNDFQTALAMLVDKLQKSIYFLFLQETHKLVLEKVPIGVKGYRHRHDIVFSQAVTSVVASFVLRLQSAILDQEFLIQLQEIGFLLHWESLLSTHGDEIGMLEDFVVVMQNINSMTMKIVPASSGGEIKVEGKRYLVKIRVPLSTTLFRLLPASLQSGKEVKVCAVLFTQGVNEQQSIADRFGDNTLQDTINSGNLQKLSAYSYRFCELFSHSNAQMKQQTRRVLNLLESLRSQISLKKNKNTDILSLSQELCRCMNCGRVTSCKSAKDRTAMSVTLEQVHLLQREYTMDPACFHQALDAMRSQGTRLENALKNVDQPLYAFNALQVIALPKNYRPPDGTYKKLQT